MTPTEKGRRRDALLYGFDTRLQLCDMIANREADLEDARAENAALLEECDGWKKLCVDQEVMHVMHEDALDNEIAKLRELARFVMHQCNDGNPRCDECIDWNGGECVALQRMRELGVDE